ATFKLGGWLGPAIVLSCWTAVHFLRGRLKQVAAACVLVLASYRAVGLVWWGPYLAFTSMPLTHDEPEWVLNIETRTAMCNVRILSPSPTIEMVERAAAESAAPQRGCSIEGL